MLTDEERRRIYEEEKARLEAQEELKRKPKTLGKGNSIGCLLLIALAVALVVICQLLPTSRTHPARASSYVSTPADYGPQLELVSWNWTRTAGGSYVEVRGQVKNISGSSLKSVAAVATFYDKDEGFITSDDALIDYNPILPGQTSPFSVLETYNPAMRSATVEFKHLMGGTIVTRGK